MTIQELQRIVVRLSNSGWVRWWSNFDCRETNVRMAIQVLDHAGAGGLVPVPVRELEAIGFKEFDEAKCGARYLYTIERTNEDGTPFVSKLF